MQNEGRVYPLEPPYYGHSKEYPQSMFYFFFSNFAQNIDLGYPLEPPH